METTNIDISVLISENEKLRKENEELTLLGVALPSSENKCFNSP